jgi:hypothetical protein
MKVIKLLAIIIALCIASVMLVNAMIRGGEQDEQKKAYYTEAMKNPDNTLACPFEDGSVLAFESRCPGVYDHGGDFVFTVDEHHKLTWKYKHTKK